MSKLYGCGGHRSYQVGTYYCHFNWWYVAKFLKYLCLQPWARSVNLGQRCSLSLTLVLLQWVKVNTETYSWEYVTEKCSYIYIYGTSISSSPRPRKCYRGGTEKNLRDRWLGEMLWNPSIWIWHSHCNHEHRAAKYIHRGSIHDWVLWHSTMDRRSINQSPSLPEEPLAVDDC